MIEPLDILPILAASPSRLITPEPEDAAAGFPFARLVLVTLGLALLALSIIALRAWRERHTDPRELAFRAVAKRMNLSAARIREIREIAAQRPSASPIGVLVREYTLVE